MNRKIDKIKQFAEEHLDKMLWLHTQDVVKLALAIAEKEGADQEIVEIAAWLHDVGFSDKRAKIVTHHVHSAEMAQSLLEELKFSLEEINRVKQCIREHMGPANTFDALLKAEGKTQEFLPRPSSLESEVVYDADMINLCGPFGVAKMIILQTRQGKDFKESIDFTKSLSVKAYNDLQTERGKEIGKKYFFVSEKFFKMIRL